MKMYRAKFPYCLLLLVIAHCYGIGAVKFERDDEGKHELIALIRDFLLMQRRPFRITSSELCWKRGDFLKLTKTLNENNFLTTPSKGKFSTFWPHEHQIFLVDLRCPGSRDVMERANNLNLLDYPFHWLLIDDDQKPRLPEGLRMYPRSKVYIVRDFRITSAYRLGRDSTAYVINDVATWNRNKSTFDYYNRLVDGRNRTNLMGMELNVSMVLVDPNSERHLLDGKDKHIDAVTKVNYPLTLHVIDAINARAKFRVHDTWGYKYPNATYFDGMMGDMQNGTAELCASPTFFVGDRIPHIDVIASTTKTKARFIFRAPPLSYVKNVYVLPFNGQVWLACFALLSIVPAIFYTITYWETNDKSFNEQEKTYNSVSRLGPSISDIAQIQIGAICQQGSEAEPISRAGRIATLFLFVAMLFLYTSYSANIVALLQSTTDSVRSLEDLLYSRISLGVEDNPWNRFFFLSESGKVHKAITQTKVAPQGKPDNFMSLETGVHRMRTEYFAFHTECTAIYKVVADTFLEHEKCGLQEIQYLDMYEPYYTVRKNTTYGEIIKAAIRKCSERGLVNRALERIYVKKPPCQNQGGNFLSVSLTDCYAAFLIFGVGLALSAFVFALETLSHRRFSAPRKLAA